MQQKALGFYTTKPVEKLKPIEALALLNRWAKIRNYFWDRDIDFLYEIKDRKIREWLETKELFANAIILRPTPAIEGMKTEIENGGINLNWLDYNSWYDYLTEIESKHLSLLQEMAEQWEHMGIEVKYPEDIYQNWLRQLQPRIESYQIALADYELEMKRRQPILEEYNKTCQESDRKRIEAAKLWAKENQIKIARSRSRKSLKKDWIERLEKKGFTYETCPEYPFPSKLKKPSAPKLPENTYIVNFENYLPGSIPEVESALNWAETLVDLPEFTCDIDSNFICDELESILQEVILDRVREEVLTIFERVITGSLSNPEKIWDELIKFEIDYSEAIGMESYYDFRSHQNYHRDYSKWQEINLSPTGYWLVEFISIEDSTISFHVPYDRIKSTSNIKINLDDLPKVTSIQANFGREINEEEKEKYPIDSLLNILGFSSEDFPFELEPYRRNNYYNFSNEDEEYWQEDEEDWEY